MNWEQRENTILFWSFRDLAAWGHKNIYCDYDGVLLARLFIYLFIWYLFKPRHENILGS